ncbi:unnamed protein product [Sphagnum jensenii]|uniref:UBR-type domain-containing protein n=2 Tax=Sphagnum jensenii TaxID=128206 RepID=A0ABP0ZXG2_9BRYO
MEDSNVEEEAVGTLSEYMDGLEAQELEADLVLGGDEGKECTYREGYKKRQAVFACRTCTPDGNAGFCTACSLSCHEGHDVVELWTRRQFRCDCGNSKFGIGICQLQADKEPENSCNVYNQNYKGVYCICRRPYPDPDGSEPGQMLQCCICEDWFHEHHLGLPPSLQVYPKDDEGEPMYDELICQACVPHCSFIFSYPEALIPPSSVIDDTAVEPVQSVEPVMPTGYCCAGNNGNKVIAPSYLNGTNQENGTTIAAQAEPSNAEIPGGGAVVCKLEMVTNHMRTSTLDHLQKATSNGLTCSSKTDVVAECPEPVWPLFLSSSWRAKLCQCPQCLNMYKEKGVSFLLNREDTIQEYEAMGKRKREEALARAEGAGSDFMQTLGHVQQIELLHGLNDMASELKSFLAPFGESGKTVTSADIHEFFEDFNQKRRRRN